MRVFSSALDQLSLPHSWLPFVLGWALATVGYAIYTPDPEVNITVMDFEEEWVVADVSGSMNYVIDTIHDTHLNDSTGCIHKDSFRFSLYDEMMMCEQGDILCGLAFMTPAKPYGNYCNDNAPDLCLNAISVFEDICNPMSDMCGDEVDEENVFFSYFGGDSVRIR